MGLIKDLFTKKEKKETKKETKYELTVITRFRIFYYTDETDDYYRAFKDWFLRQHDKEYYVFKYNNGEDVFMRHQIKNVIFKRIKQ